MLGDLVNKLSAFLARLQKIILTKRSGILTIPLTIQVETFAALLESCQIRLP